MSLLIFVTVAFIVFCFVAATTKEGFGQLAIPRSVGHYDDWSMLMEIFLGLEVYWQIIESDILRREQSWKS